MGKKGVDKKYFLVREKTRFTETGEVYRGYISLCPRRSIDSY